MGQVPGASMLLPVGRVFDVLDVTEAAGRRALVRMERMGLPLGPVAVTPAGRAQFFVAPGAAAELPQLLYRMGWDDAGLDLRALGPGCHITAPPSDEGGRGPVRWLRPPVLDTAAARRRRACCWARWRTAATARRCAAEHVTARLSTPGPGPHAGADAGAEPACRRLRRSHTPAPIRGPGPYTGVGPVTPRSPTAAVCRAVGLLRG